MGNKLCNGPDKDFSRGLPNPKEPTLSIKVNKDVRVNKQQSKAK